MTAERWRPVPNFEGSYEVSDRGHVKSVRRLILAGNRWGQLCTRRIGGRLLRPNPTGWVTLCDDGTLTYARITDLVAEAFGHPEQRKTA
jgi:NUMOD4 motif